LPRFFKKNTTNAFKAAQSLVFDYQQTKEKASQVIDLGGLNLVGDTWIEHVTPAV
jgi:hypothetical protein